MYGSTSSRVSPLTPTKGKMALTNGAYFGAIGFGVLTVSFGGVALMGGGR